MLVGKERSDELSKRKNGKKSKKLLKTPNELDDEYHIIIANMQALRQLDNVVYGNIVKMFGWEK